MLLDPPPSVTNCHTFSDPLPSLSSVTYFMDGPYLGRRSVSQVGVANTRQSSLQLVPLCNTW